MPHHTGAMLLLMRMLLVAAAATVTLLAQLNLPDEINWQRLHAVLYISVFVLAAEAALQLIDVVLRAASLPKLREYEHKMQASLGAAMTMMVRSTQADWSQIGVHAFLARRRLSIRTRLLNVGRLRISGVPSMEGPAWFSGKGVIGRAFQTEDTVAEDWFRFFQVGIANGPRGWKRLSREQRYGLNWGELQLTSQYRGIVARPIWSPRGRLIGCVSLDAPLQKSRLLQDDIEVILKDLSVAVSTLGYPPVGWYSRLSSEI